MMIESSDASTKGPRAILYFFTNGGEDCQTKGKWEQVKSMYSMDEVGLRSRVGMKHGLRMAWNWGVKWFKLGKSTSVDESK